MSPVERFTLRTQPVLHLFVGVDAVECAAAYPQGRSLRWVEGSFVRVAIEGELGVRGALAALATREAPLATSGLHVVVVDSWLAVGSVPWSSALKRRRSAELNGRLHLAVDGHEVGAADTVRIDDGAFAEPQLAVAYAAELMSALENLTDRWDTTLLSVVPLSTVAWEAARAGAAMRSDVDAVTVIGDGYAMLLRSIGAEGRGRMSNVQVRTALAEPTAALRAVADLWRRATLRDTRVSGASRVALVDLTSGEAMNAAQLSPPFVLSPVAFADGDLSTSPSRALRCIANDSRASGVDAIRYQKRASPWHWAAVAASVALLAVVATHASRTHAEREQLAAHVGALAGAVPPVPPPRRAFNREEIAKAQAVNAAVRELNLPIAALLDALQPPRDVRVAVLSVETSESAPGESANHAGVRIVAEARSSADMARYAAYVSDSKPFVTAYVIRHEVDESVLEHPYRFTLEATWSN